MHGSLERRAESDRGVVGDLYDEDFCGFASLNGMTDTDCPRKQPPPAAQTPPLGRPLVYSGRRPGSSSDPRRLQSNATPTTAIPKPTTSDACRPCPLPPKEKIRRSQRVPSTASNRQPRSTNDAPRYRSIESRTLPSTGSPDRGFSDLLRLMRFDSERPIRPAQSITHGGCGRRCLTQRDAARGRDGLTLALAKGSGIDTNLIDTNLT